MDTGTNAMKIAIGWSSRDVGLAVSVAADRTVGCMCVLGIIVILVLYLLLAKSVPQRWAVALAVIMLGIVSTWAICNLSIYYLLSRRDVYGNGKDWDPVGPTEFQREWE